MGSNRLHIRRLHAQCLVPNDHPAPQRIKGRIEEAVAQHLLGQTLSGLLSKWFSAADESVWLIRRLELDVAVNAAWEREQVTRVIAMQIARMLGATLQHETGDENVLRFANRAAYLAHFLTDLAQGTAWGKWYYESFAGLRPLSTSAALRTAICDQPDTGQEALLQLADHELKRVLRILTSQDARRILDSLAAQKVGASQFQCCEAAWAVWRSSPPDSFTSADEWCQVLHLFVTASREQPDAGGVALKKASMALVRLAQLLATRSTEQNQQLMSALTDSDVSSLHGIVGEPVAERLMPLLRCPSAWVREVIEALLAPQTGQARAETAGSRRDTSFGGILLLLPLLDELPLVEATSGWAHADEAAAITLVRFLLLVKCCGQQHAQRAFYDPLLRDLLLIPPAISPLLVREWSGGITAAQVRSFLETMIDWQRSRGAVHDKVQILARAGSGTDSVAILIDGARGHWLTVERYTPQGPQRLTRALRNFLSRLDPDDGMLLCEPSLLSTLWSAFSDVRMISLEDEIAQRVPGEGNELGGILARLGKLTTDLSHLALPDSFRLARGLDGALSVAVQNLLRSFAWRLPGFAASSLPYLSANFLDFSGSVEEEPERRVVRLGRPLLHLVSSLTGMSRQTYRLSWLDERPLCLFPED